MTTSEAASRLRLRRSMRLKTRREFTHLRTAGCRLAKGCLIANWVLRPAGSLPRLGLITTRKLGKATIRTRARRLLREAFRLHQHHFQQPVEMVLIARPSIVGKTLADVERDLLSLLQQAKLLKAID